jgi:hypothetical protein
MDIKCLGQPEYHSLSLEFGLGLQWRGERDLPTGQTELPSERHWDAITAGGANAFREASKQGLAVAWRPTCPPRERADHRCRGTGFTAA